MRVMTFQKEPKNVEFPAQAIQGEEDIQQSCHTPEPCLDEVYWPSHTRGSRKKGALHGTNDFHGCPNRRAAVMKVVVEWFDDAAKSCYGSALSC